MRIPFGSILGCCAAALPLIGCAGGLTPMPPQAGPSPAALAATIPGPGIYIARTGTPAAPLRPTAEPSSAPPTSSWRYNHSGSQTSAS